MVLRQVAGSLLDNHDGSKLGFYDHLNRIVKVRDFKPRRALSKVSSSTTTTSKMTLKSIALVVRRGARVGYDRGERKITRKASGGFHRLCSLSFSSTSSSSFFEYRMRTMCANG